MQRALSQRESRWTASSSSDIVLAEERVNIEPFLVTATPLHDGMLPEGCTVHSFDAKPSFIFANAHASLVEAFRDEVESRLWSLIFLESWSESKGLRKEDFEYVGQERYSYGNVAKINPDPDDPCNPGPVGSGHAKHGTAAADVSLGMTLSLDQRCIVDNLDVRIERAQLHPQAGAFLAPMFICEFQVGKAKVRAFVNGATGACVRPEGHISFAAVATVWTAVGLVTGFCFAYFFTHGFSEIGTHYGGRHPVMWVDYVTATLFGVCPPLVGWSWASTRSVATEENWRESDDRQNRRRQNDVHGCFYQVFTAERTDKAKWEKATIENDVRSAKFWQIKLQKLGNGWHEREGTNKQ